MHMVWVRLCLQYFYAFILTQFPQNYSDICFNLSVVRKDLHVSWRL